MKRLHRKDLYGWSKFHEPLNIDFNSVVWVRGDGNVVVDPLPLSEHDLAHLKQLGGAKTIVITNSAHLRGALELQKATGAQLTGPAAEREKLTCDRYVTDGESVVPGLVVRVMEGSKTPGELALVLEDTTLITGDLVRSHRADTLMLLGAEQGIRDRAAAIASLRRVLNLHPRLEAILVGDGWSLFREGHRRLGELLDGAS
jgi:hypothetical protein